jgi:hypothetical protein
MSVSMHCKMHNNEYTTIRVQKYKCEMTQSNRIFDKIKCFPLRECELEVYLYNLSTMSLVKFDSIPTF